MTDATHRVGEATLEQHGEVLVSQATLRPTQKTGLAEAPTPGAALGRSEAGTSVAASMATVRPTMKFDQETFPVVSVHSTTQGGVLITDHPIRDTLKTGLVTEPHRTNDPSQPDLGSLLTTQATVRATQKQGMVDQPFRVGDPDSGTIGGVLATQATIRPTLRIHTETSFPALGVQLEGDPSGHLQIDTPLPTTRRMTTAVLTHQPGPAGQEMGDILQLQNLTSHQVRGLRQQHYIPQNSRVPDGMGGTNTRVISEMKQARPGANMGRGHAPGPGIIQENQYRAGIPSMRLTQRTIDEIRDQLAGEDNESYAY